MWTAQFTATIRQHALQRRKQAHKGKLLVSAALVLAMVSALSGVSLSPSALQFSSRSVGIGSEVRAIKLTNRGSSDFRPEHIEVKGPAASDFVIDRRTCAVVPSGQSCRLLVEYRPQLPGARQAQLVVTSGDGRQLEAALSGSALPAALKISPSTLKFDGIAPGGKSEGKQITLMSEGAFHIRGVSLQGDSDQFSQEGDSCKRSPGGLKSCVISVNFEPRSEGNWSARLVIDDDAPGSPHVVNLRGVSLNPAPPALARQPAHTQPTHVTPKAPSSAPETVASTKPADPAPVPPSPPPAPSAPTAPQPQLDPRPPVDFPQLPRPPRPTPSYPRIRVFPASLDFSTNREQRVTVFNDGSAPLQIGLRLVGQDPGRFGADPRACRYPIAPGGSCVIPVFYGASQTVRQTTYYSAQLQIEHNAGNLGTQYVPLQWRGIVVARPHLTTKPNVLDFSRFYQVVAMRTLAPATPQLPLTLVNDGQVDLRQLNLRLGAANTGPFRPTSNCRQLPVGQACTETIFFQPRTRGNYSDKLHILEGTQLLAVVDLKALMPAAPPPTAGNYGSDVSVLQHSRGPKLGTVLQNPDAVNDATILNNPAVRRRPSPVNLGIVKAGSNQAVPQVPRAGSSAGNFPRNAGLVNKTTVSSTPTIKRNAPAAKARTTHRVAAPSPPDPPR